jgi:hypothetical protein
LHRFVFIDGRQASGRWIDVAIRRLRINWEFIFVCRKLVFPSAAESAAGHIIPGFSAVERMRKQHYMIGLADMLRLPEPAGPAGPAAVPGTFSPSSCTQLGHVRCSLDSREEARMAFLSAGGIFSRSEKVLCEESSSATTAS